MMKLQINLSSRPFANHTLYHLGYVVIGLVGLLLLVHNAHWFFSNHSDVRQMEQEIAVLQTEVDGHIREARSLGEGIDQVQRNRRFREVCAFVDGRIRQRRFSWIRMLNLLQEAIPPDVKIESITPRVQQESVRITLVCVARKDAAVNLFIENLEGIDEFDRVLITSESKEGRTISFPLTMEYSPFGYPGAEARGETAETLPGMTDGEADAGEAPEPEKGLAEAVDLAELPDPDFPEMEPSEDGDIFDLFAVEGGDPFASGDEVPFGFGDDLFGAETSTVPAAVTESNPAPMTGSQKTGSSGALIKKSPRKLEDRQQRPRPPGRRPGGRP